jgi:S1-C subfamily serine protease
MSWADAVVVVLLLGAAWSGFRRGFISSMTALVGALAGVVAALLLAPVPMGWVSDGTAQIAIAIACVILGVGLGEVGGGALGAWLSRRITWRPARVVDVVLGLLGHTAAVLVVIWLIAIPLASSPVPVLSSAVRSSAVLRWVDGFMPGSWQSLPDRMRRLLDDSGFPAVLDPLTPTPDTPVAPPDPAVTQLTAVRTAAASVLKVRGQAPSCSRAIEGSGFVIAPERLLTNAHVVAGTKTVDVEENGRRLAATVVEFDPETDVAVLAVPGLTAAPLTFATGADAKSGTGAVVVGYPLDGPLTLGAARVRADFTLHGPDIYDARNVDRKVYTLRADVRAGNSGGPLLATDGRVLGVIFGAAVDKPDVGFALTNAQVEDVVAGAAADSTPVGTGACATG